MNEMIRNNKREASRRDVLALLGAGVTTLAAMPTLAQAQGREPSEAAVLHDPDIAVAGNPDGDIASSGLTISAPIAARWSRSYARWCRTTARSACC